MPDDLPNYRAHYIEALHLVNTYANRVITPAEIQAQALTMLAAGLFAIADAIQTAGRKPDA